MTKELEAIVERYEAITKEMRTTLDAIERSKEDSKRVAEIHQFIEQFDSKEEFTGLIKELKKNLFYLKDELTIGEAAKYLGVSVSTLYKMTMNNEIVFYRPGKRRLYFKRQDLQQWMSTNRQATNEEMQREASLSDLTNLFAPKRNKHKQPQKRMKNDQR